MKYIKKLMIGLLTVVLCACSTSEPASANDSGSTDEAVITVNEITGNGVEEFDLEFLKLENDEKNIVYSPLSIKYALSMLMDAASGNTKSQIESVIGSYIPKKYESSANMSFANALFVKDGFEIQDSYKELIRDKYDGDVLNDSFDSPERVNAYVSDKTMNLINDFYDDVSSFEFILLNALAIDMEWVEKVQNGINIEYAHETIWKLIDDFRIDSPIYYKFNDGVAVSLEFGGLINKYDIVKELGEDTIRETVRNAYIEAMGDSGVEEYLNQYMDSISRNYGTEMINTDFAYYLDDDVKVFAKDLREYNGTTLQYVAFMPLNETLNSYVSHVNAKELQSYIDALIVPGIDNVEEGYVTEFKGYIPEFKIDYQLELMDDLKALGVIDVFDGSLADLSNLTKGAFIGAADHKATIEFSNDGIKAAAATAGGGYGADGFDYKYDVPVKVIDLEFRNPFLYLIRDKSSGEVWFTGTVYEPDSTIYSSEEINSNVAQGKVTSKVDHLNVRNEPSTSGEKNKYWQLNTGSVYEFYDCVENDGYTWYQIGNYFNKNWIADDGTWLDVQWY